MLHALEGKTHHIRITETSHFWLAAACVAPAIMEQERLMVPRFWSGVLEREECGRANARRTSEVNLRVCRAGIYLDSLRHMLPKFVRRRFAMSLQVHGHQQLLVYRVTVYIDKRFLKIHSCSPGRGPDG